MAGNAIRTRCCWTALMLCFAVVGNVTICDVAPGVDPYGDRKDNDVG